MLALQRELQQDIDVTEQHDRNDEPMLWTVIMTKDNDALLLKVCHGAVRAWRHIFVVIATRQGFTIRGWNILENVFS